LLTTRAADAVPVMGVNRQPVRILARVAPASPSGNALSLEVLAVALDAEVAARELELRPPAGRPARAAPARWAEGSASRSGGGRQMPSIPLGSLSTLAARALSPEAQAIYPAYRDYIHGCNRRLSEQELDVITVSLLHFSAANQIDPRLVVAMVIAESDFDPRSTSSKGAMGLGQLMPDEARANRLTNPYDPAQNLGTAIGLLRGKLDRYRTQPVPAGQYTLDQVTLALAAYNAGPGAVKKYGGVPPYRETQGYIRRILRIYRQLTGQC
jgi:soluble lytic murein transglycosylase-like protein